MTDSDIATAVEQAKRWCGDLRATIKSAELRISPYHGREVSQLETLETLLADRARLEGEIAALRKAATESAWPADFYHHTRHPWAQPGDHPDRIWLLRFDDADMRDMVWTMGDAEAEAKSAYARHCPSWNVYLFATVSTVPTPAPASQSAAISGLVEACLRLDPDAGDARDTDADVCRPARDFRALAQALSAFEKAGAAAEGTPDA